MHRMDWSATRPGEVEGGAPDRTDAGIVFVGTIRTPFATRAECPHRGTLDGPPCRIEVAPPWRTALRGIVPGQRLEVLYWMHLARRDLLVQAPKGRPEPLGTFALRSPNRPNPISISEVEVVAVAEDGLTVRGLDCVDGTPLVDIKAARR